MLQPDHSQLRQKVPMFRAFQFAFQFPSGVRLKGPVALEAAHKADLVVSARALDTVIALSVGRIVQP
jgi:hypothetical protein